MADRSFTTSFTVEQPPQDVYAAVTDPRSWWSEGIVGSAAAAGDEFTYRYEDVHYCRIRVTEAVPGKAVTWHVLENSFSFITDPTEWVGTTARFEIVEVEGGTEVRFTHDGLVPEYECYDVCHGAWTHYLNESLKDLIATGHGHPNAEGTARTEAERALGTGKGFATAITVDATADAVVAALLNPRAWWSASIEGDTGRVGDTFIFNVPGVHWSRIRVSDIVPGRQVVWDVLDARIEYVEDKAEWTGTRLVFDVAPHGGGTRVTLTHVGLVPELACYESCSASWQDLATGSLRELITTGRANPPF
jgi:uncharacterized protein YndB with AHSA1/START domain